MKFHRGYVLSIVAVALMAVGGCAGEASTRTEPTTGPLGDRATATPSTPSSEAAGESPPSHAAEGLTLDELQQRVLAAVRAESSVHSAIGNLNPPPAAQMDQDYSTPNGDLEVTISIYPDAPPLVARRVDGQVYISSDGVKFDPVPQEKAQKTPNAIGGLLRTDVLKDLTGIFRAAVGSDYLGPDPALGDGVDSYRLEIDTATWYRAQSDGEVMGIPSGSSLPRSIPVMLWVGPDGLPVRVQVRYSPPINGIEGTGTGRTDYTHWSEPVHVERPET